MNIYEKFSEDDAVKMLLDYIEENNFIDRKSMDLHIVNCRESYGTNLHIKVIVNDIYYFDITANVWYCYIDKSTDGYILSGKMKAYTNDTKEVVLLEETEFSITK